MEERDAKIKTLLERGVPKVRIARQIGVSRETVDRVAARVGFPSRARGARRHDWDAIRRFYDAGHTAETCLKEFGLSHATWRAAIARGEIVPRRQPEQLPAGRRRQCVADLLTKGLGVAQIAERLGIAKPTVCYHARKLGGPPRTEFARRFDWTEIRRAYEAGASMRQCKARFGFSGEPGRRPSSVARSCPVRV